MFKIYCNYYPVLRCLGLTITVEWSHASQSTAIFIYHVSVYGALKKELRQRALENFPETMVYSLSVRDGVLYVIYVVAEV